MTELDSRPMSTERTIPSPPDTRERSTNADNGKKLRKHCDLPDETLLCGHTYTVLGDSDGQSPFCVRRPGTRTLRWNRQRGLALTLAIKSQNTTR